MLTKVIAPEGTIPVTAKIHGDNIRVGWAHVNPRDGELTTDLELDLPHEFYETFVKDYTVIYRMTAVELVPQVKDKLYMKE